MKQRFKIIAGISAPKNESSWRGETYGALALKKDFSSPTQNQAEGKTKRKTIGNVVQLFPFANQEVASKELPSILQEENPKGVYRPYAESLTSRLKSYVFMMARDDPFNKRGPRLQIMRRRRVMARRLSTGRYIFEAVIK